MMKLACLWAAANLRRWRAKDEHQQWALVTLAELAGR